MNILVTGAAGFLGSALANRLVLLGHHVRGLDDLSAGDPARLSPQVALSRGDVNDRPKLWSLLQDVECVYHLAARVSVPESVLYPRDYDQVNVGGTVTLMEAIRDVGVPRIILASSGAVYGEQRAHLLHEALPPDPRSPYAVSKLAAEHYVRTIGHLVGTHTLALRVFNAYGPGQPLPAVHAPVIPRFLQQALQGGSVVMHGEGRQTRDYVYVDDVIDALVAAAVETGESGQVINIGSGQATSVRDLVDLVAAVTGRRLEPLSRPSESIGVSAMQADLTLARRRLGFAPQVQLAEGLRRTFEYDPRFALAR
jgi:UDP-glucose 4-epimerase